MGSQTSPSIPPIMATVEEPNIPIMKRETKIVGTFVATATGIWKMADIVNPTIRGLARP
jgi:hypothetical protein